MRLVVPAVPPFDPAPTVAALAAHAVPGVETVDRATGTCVRALATTRGPVPVAVTLTADGAAVEVPDDVPAAGAHELRALVRWWFDLDHDPATTLAALGADPTVGPLVRARPGVRVLRHPDGFAAAVSTVLGQQVSVAAARTVTGRLVASFGDDGADGRRLFPSPERLAALEVDALRGIGLTAARAATVRGVARAVVDGLRIGPGTDVADVRRRLLALPGVGPWTVEYLALRALGDDDAFPAGDLVLQRALAVRGRAAAEAAAARWSPVRGRAAVHLWTDAVYAPAPLSGRSPAAG